MMRFLSQLIGRKAPVAETSSPPADEIEKQEELCVDPQPEEEKTTMLGPNDWQVESGARLREMQDVLSQVKAALCPQNAHNCDCPRCGRTHIALHVGSPSATGELLRRIDEALK